MSEHSRPVYIPVKSRSNKRRRDERLHGAFKGGFSAGHFNTVGSKKGWNPSSDNYDGEDINIATTEENQQQELQKNMESDYYSRPAWRPKARSGTNLSSKKGNKKQNVEDFMDEEDANDWGGPAAIRKDYTCDFDSGVNPDCFKENDSKTISSAKSVSELLSGGPNLQGNGHGSLSIGKQLLRVLGWREAKHKGKDGIMTEYVYLPVEEGEHQNQQNDVFLASKRIKRIELKLSKYKKKALPKPKMDSHGIGYDAFENAPEFKAHKEMRQRKAEMRARAASSTHGDDRMNVYRTNVLADEEEGSDDGYAMVKRKGQMGWNTNKEDEKGNTGTDEVLAYETTEDFVGQTTAGGFALHDDDDDVYDDQMGNGLGIGKKESKVHIDKDEYHTEIFEESDSDLDTDNFEQASSQPKKCQNDGNVNVFAGALGAWATGNAGGNMESSRKKVIAVTSDGKPPLKGFTVGSDFTRNLKMQRYPGPMPPADYVPKRHKFHQTDALKKLKELSYHMKQQMMSQRRAESAKSQSNDREGGIKRDLIPMAGGSFSALADSLKNRFTSSQTEVVLKGTDKSGPSDPTKVAIIRNTVVWQPTSLLCKRMNVNLPRSFNASNIHIQGQTGKQSQSREQSFFSKEVIGKMNPNAQWARENDVYHLSGGDVDIERPTLEFMKSIFEAESDDDMSISDDDQESESEKVNIAEIRDDSKIKVTTVEHNSDTKNETSQVDDALAIQKDPNGPKSKKERRRRKRDDSSDEELSRDGSSSDSDVHRRKRGSERRRGGDDRKHSRRRKRKDRKSEKRKKKHR